MTGILAQPFFKELRGDPELIFQLLPELKGQLVLEDLVALQSSDEDEEVHMRRD